MAEARPGAVALMGSGETSPTGRQIHEGLFRRLTPPVRVAILETPAGFEVNSAHVAGQISEFLQTHLPNYQPQVNVIPARRRGAVEGPDNPLILAPLLMSNYIFMGPGSPSYAVRHLADTLAMHMVVARHRLGATLSFASAAAVAMGRYALPTYEIYKAGEDPHWRPGLDLLGPFGMNLVFITHWNNSEGGAHLDTSRCYMGEARMNYLLSLLPPEVTVLGIDEHTALIMDMVEESCSIMGRGGVTRIYRGRETVYPSGSTFSLHELGDLRWPAPEEGIPPEVWQEVLQNHLKERVAGAEAETLPDEIASLIQWRESARGQKDWATANAIRRCLEAQGYQVMDTPQGPRWKRPLPMT